MTEEVTRKVILHYHIFKNGDTSVDALLQRNFPALWMTAEFEKSYKANRKSAKKCIIENPKAVCFSSHTENLSPPKISGVEVLPIIFLRHPIDQIASAYYFERKRSGENFGSVLAQHTTLQGYVEARLSLKRDRQCRNLLASRFAKMSKAKCRDERTRAFCALAMLPFVGLVDQFETSIELMR